MISIEIDESRKVQYVVQNSYLVGSLDKYITEKVLDVYVL